MNEDLVRCVSGRQYIRYDNLFRYQADIAEYMQYVLNDLVPLDSVRWIVTHNNPVLSNSTNSIDYYFNVKLSNSFIEFLHVSFHDATTASRTDEGSVHIKYNSVGQYNLRFQKGINKPFHPGLLMFPEECAVSVIKGSRGALFSINSVNDCPDYIKNINACIMLALNNFTPSIILPISNKTKYLKYKTKYLKYKTKYLELKKKINL